MTRISIKCKNDLHVRLNLMVCGFVSLLTIFSIFLSYIWGRFSFVRGYLGKVFNVLVSVISDL